MDWRDEWYSEWNIHAAFINHPPKLYWLGMTLSAFWVVAYLVIYPSIPFVSFRSHWQGVGVPWGCQPWTAICEMEQDEAVLYETRGRFLYPIASNELESLSDGGNDLAEFILRAGRVRFASDCAGCHGVAGVGIKKHPELAPVLTGGNLLHGGSVQQIKQSIQSREVHPFGMAARIDDTTAKILAIYVSGLRH